MAQPLNSSTATIRAREGRDELNALRKKRVVSLARSAIGGASGDGFFKTARDAALGPAGMTISALRQKKY